MTAKKAKVGGVRPGSGKPAFFRKAFREHGGHKAPLSMSSQAFAVLDEHRAALTVQLQRREGFQNREVSRNAFIEALIRKHGRGLTLADIFRLEA